jgi:hypothetical protein
MVCSNSGFQEQAVEQADGKQVAGWASWRVHRLMGFRTPWGPSAKQRLVLAGGDGDDDREEKERKLTRLLPSLDVPGVAAVVSPGTARRFQMSYPPSHDSFSSFVNLERSKSPMLLLFLSLAEQCCSEIRKENRC